MAVTESKLVRDLVGAIKDGTKEKTKAYETPATVTRIEDGTAWVHVPGGVEETPVQLTINATEGDQVRVRVANGKATIVGNVTSPPTDDSTAKEALANANSAIQSARNAATAAASAEASAETAKTAAEDAVETAEAVHDIAVQAQTDANTAKANAQTAINNAAAAQTAAANAQTSADSAQTSADNASEYAARALGNLSTVQNVAETLNWITAHGTMTLTTDTALDPTHVYFVQDNNGDYTVGGTRYAVVTEPNVADISTYYELSIDESLNNYVATHLALTGDGLYIMADGSWWKVLIADDGVYILDPNNEPANQMTANGNIVGYEDETHVEIDYHSLQLIARGETTPYFWVSDLRDKNDDYQATITETFISYNDTATFTVQLPVTAEVSAVDSSDSSNTATRNGQAYTFATIPNEGATITIVYKTKSPQAKAYTIGQRASGGVGIMSVAEGLYTIASGCYSHAEGRWTTASGFLSHAEGYSTTASGKYSHAEGFATTASDDGAHAEGSHSEALGRYSHAQNFHTVTKYQSQTAIGRYNDNKSYTAFEIGNGTGENNRSNAFTVDWSGNVNASGNVTDGSGNALSDLANCVLKATPYFELDTTATSGSDKDIYDALVALGWTDCIV